MRRETRSHLARPSDLVALVTFDDEVRENQAVTLDRLIAGEHGSRPLNVAVAQWLHLGRRLWVNLQGREVKGIATARDLGDRSVWLIDTLIDAGAPGSDEVVSDLLTQAIEAARRSKVAQLLLRTARDAEARSAAWRVGFRPLVPERRWVGVLGELGRSAAVSVREVEPGDRAALFALYRLSVPAQVRSQLALTDWEWAAMQERRARGGGVQLLAEQDGQPVAALSLGEAAARVQFSLTAHDSADQAVRTLLEAMRERVGPERAETLVARHARVVETVLAEAGLRVADEYVLQAVRLRQPINVRLPVAPRLATRAGAAG